MPHKWVKINQVALAEHVTREARKILSPDINVRDLLQEEDGISKIVEKIYNALLERKVQYALEPHATAKPEPTQEIRTPSEVLESLKEGTCLDIALLFCGVCLGCELLPVLIVFEDHTLVAVSRNHGVHEWDRRGRGEDALFKDAVVREDKFSEIFKLIIEDEAYLVIECTGVACSRHFEGEMPECAGRSVEGTFDFKRAIEAGTQQFDPRHGRKFKFALDIAVAHYHHKIEPLESEDGAAVRGESLARQGDKESEANPLPYHLDRSDQETALRKAIQNHQKEPVNRPLVCVIHGNEYECHAEFIVRLREISLPRILMHWYPAKAAQTPVLSYRMELWLSALSEPDWEDTLWEALVTATILSPDAPPDLVASSPTREGVVNFISRHKLAVVIDIPLLTEKLEGVAPENLNRLFDFWNNWGNLPDGLLLVVCLSFKYQRSYVTQRKWYHALAGSRTLNDRFREYVDNLDFERYENLYGVCLPELQAILQSEAEAAVNHPAVKRHYGYTDSDVRRMYKSTRLGREIRRIPMDTLIIKFDKVRKERST